MLNYFILLLNMSVALVMAVQVNFYFNSVLGKENSKSSKWVYNIVFLIFNVLYLSIDLLWLWSSLLALALIFILSMGYEVVLRMKIIFSFLYAVLLTLVNTICLFVLNPEINITAAGSNYDVQSSQFIFASSLLLSCTVMFAVIQIIRIIAKRKYYSIHLRYFFLLLCVPVISIYQVNVLILYSEKNVHYFLSVFGYIVLNILVVYILDTVIARFQLLHENELLQRQMDYQDATYEKTVHSFKKIKSIIHDTNQQFLYVNECIERGSLEDAKEHIKVTLNMIEEAYFRVNTGNLAVDALLTNALNIGQDNGIRIDTELRLYDKDIPVERYDLCIVIGNMIDNAIEASKKVKVAADRNIKVHIRSNETALFIRINNYVEREVVNLHSQKTSPDYHGFGLTNIKRICEKYGGHMTIVTEAHTFDNMVVLPFNKKNS